ncbi:hypothetical protein KKB40_03850 [Patescibacteria group bacterium]|nr:hypothetical protein [Patescibacteria group bacterium]
MKTAIIARVSTEEQKKAGNSLVAQIALTTIHFEYVKFQLAPPFLVSL